MEKSTTSAVSRPSIAPGLYFVATPIGAARDITLRGLDLLEHADVLAAEDTRNTRKLMDIHGIPLNGRRIIAYHDHNGAAQRPRLIEALKEGKTIAYVSDAGTPLIADPGFALGQAAIAEGLPVFAAPGPSAVLAALTVAGLPTDKFLFSGFLPTKTKARQNELNAIADLKASLVFFESAKRIKAMLTDVGISLGNRQVSLCRELTKKFEEIRRGTVSQVLEDIENGAMVKGEYVVVIAPPLAKETTDEDINEVLTNTLQSHSLKDAVAIVADMTGTPRKTVYQLALSLKDT